MVEVGLASDQNFSFIRELRNDQSEVTFSEADYISLALKDRNYLDIYSDLAAERAYSLKMPDGALIQMMYSFRGHLLERHRLAWFPSPFLEEFQNNPEVYLEDEVYADVTARSIVPFPLRFDYDARAGIAIEIEHPISHLTLGQYENCRIPVTAPITPFMFVDFILRNFYHTAFFSFADQMPRRETYFDDCILAAERAVVHVQIPVAGK